MGCLLLLPTSHQRNGGLVKQEIKDKKVSQQIGDPRLLPWQKLLLEELNEEPDDRKVIWYVDKRGCSSKTLISRYLALDSNNTIRFENGIYSDIKHAYDGQYIVIIDLSRASESHFNYEIIETLKNGAYFSPKYNSCCKTSPIPHMVIFANCYHDPSKLSRDRWDIRLLRNVDIEKDLLDIHTSEVYELPE